MAASRHLDIHLRAMTLDSIHLRAQICAFCVVVASRLHDCIGRIYILLK